MDKNKTAVSIFNKNAEQYQEKFMDVNSYSPSFDLFCDSLQPNAEVLELACGPGNITKYLLTKRPDLKILATDLAPNMVTLAKINNPTAEVIVMDCREINLLDKKYNAIMCGFCLPYLSKEEAVKLIADASKLLKPGGIIYISTMEDVYTKSAFKKGSTGEEIFMHYHQADYLTQALKENKFMIIDLTRQDSKEKDGSTTTDLILIAEK
ncbi:MAG: class I SAM-dependent methyltransferase [Bacteroidetes bacterium]|nr:class I SAM-dependent methyltransferase [Bacteroidota bacterium]